MGNSAVPRFITPRSSPHTYGAAVAKLAAANGKPLMPWQRLAADLLGECDSDGRLLHRLGVVTVPRQAGKTTLMTPTTQHRALRRPQQRIWMTAQSGMMARELLLEQVDSLIGSPLASALRTTRASANTSVTVTANGSRIKAHPPTHDALHGVQSDLNVIDEGWAYSTDTADALMAAITPTQATRPDPQTLIVSTVGTADSLWFHGLIERGRLGQGVALIDYGVPEGTDPDDFDTIIAAHPAVGITQTPESIREARSSLSAAAYLRAYGNLATAAISPLWTTGTIDAVTGTDSIPEHARIGWGVAVDSGNRQSAVIVAAALVDDMAYGELIDLLPADAVPERIAQLVARHGGSVAVDAAGPSITIADQLARRVPVTGIDLRRMTAAVSSSAAMELIDRVDAGRIRVRAHPMLSAAMGSAATRRIGDRLIWARTNPAGVAVAASTAPVEALAAAMRAAADTRAPIPISVVFG